MSRVLAYLMCRVFEFVLAMATVQLAFGIGRLVSNGVPSVLP